MDSYQNIIKYYSDLGVVYQLEFQIHDIRSKESINYDYMNKINRIYEELNLLHCSFLKKLITDQPLERNKFLQGPHYYYLQIEFLWNQKLSFPIQKEVNLFQRQFWRED